MSVDASDIGLVLVVGAGTMGVQVALQCYIYADPAYARPGFIDGTTS